MKAGIGTALLVVGGAVGQAGALQQVPPAFRSDIDLVSVDVSVRRGNLPVRGLSASDFTLLDNGVAQTVTALDTAAVPLDVSLVVDVSGSTASYRSKFRSDVAQIAALLRAEDRLRVIVFGTRVEEVLSARSAAIEPQLEWVDAPDMANLTSVHDALISAMIRPVDTDRRHLLVAFTDLVDNFSISTTAAVVAVAQRSEAALHVVIPSSPSASGEYPGYPAPLIGEGNFENRELLAKAARDTGGDTHRASLGGSVVPAFRKILDDYRDSYLLHYELAGVPRKGWHEIRVQVQRAGRYEIRARRGYFIESR